MTILGIDALSFGVEDLAEAARFLDDWGLERQADGAGLLHFQTRDRTELVVRGHLDPALPPAMQVGSTLRCVTWGLRDAASLQAMRTRLGDQAVDIGGQLGVRDPSGLTHCFRVSQKIPVVADGQDVNAPGVVRRIDLRSPIYERARPISVGHIVLFVDSLPNSLEFFVERLGFVVSDSYPGHAAFLRACTPGPHHHAFILSRPGRPGLNHVAFTVNNIHEVFGGGLAMSRRGWQTDLGPGRHPISSAYFWYFKSPLGAPLEYYADDDWCTEAWRPGNFERTPENFAEWAVTGGLDGTTRRQTRGPTTT